MEDSPTGFISSPLAVQMYEPFCDFEYNNNTDYNNNNIIDYNNIEYTKTKLELDPEEFMMTSQQLPNDSQRSNTTPLNAQNNIIFDTFDTQDHWINEIMLGDNDFNQNQPSNYSTFNEKTDNKTQPQLCTSELTFKKEHFSQKLCEDDISTDDKINTFINYQNNTSPFTQKKIIINNKNNKTVHNNIMNNKNNNEEILWTQEDSFDFLCDDFKLFNGDLNELSDTDNNSSNNNNITNNFNSNNNNNMNNPIFRSSSLKSNLNNLKENINNDNNTNNNLKSYILKNSIMSNNNNNNNNNENKKSIQVDLSNFYPIVKNNNNNTLNNSNNNFAYQFLNTKSIADVNNNNNFTTNNIYNNKNNNIKNNNNKLLTTAQDTYFIVNCPQNVLYNNNNNDQQCVVTQDDDINDMLYYVTDEDKYGGGDVFKDNYLIISDNGGLVGNEGNKGGEAVYDSFSGDIENMSLAQILYNNNNNNNNNNILTIGGSGRIDLSSNTNNNDLSYNRNKNTNFNNNLDVTELSDEKCYFQALDNNNNNNNNVNNKNNNQQKLINVYKTIKQEPTKQPNKASIFNKMDNNNKDGDDDDSVVVGNHNLRKRKRYISEASSATGDLSDDDHSSSEDEEALDDLLAGLKSNHNNSSTPSDTPKYFWQYNILSKGPKGRRLCSSIDNPDPHVLFDFQDPVFNREQSSYKHNGKARRGDGNDVTPNPLKLFNTGIELQKLTRQINLLTPKSDFSANQKNKVIKERNKLASRACRLKKKAQHEANKLKLCGLKQEHQQIINCISLIKQLILQASPLKNEEGFMQNFIEANKDYTFKVAGSSAEFVNSVLEKVANGDKSGGVDVDMC